MAEENNIDVQETGTAQTSVPETNSTAAPASTEQKTTDLNISDLVALKSIIDVATQRGAFKAAEMEAVGKTYNKLTNFLETVTKQKEGE